MKKNYLFIIGIIAFLMGCNPAASDNKKLQEEAESYGSKTKELLKEGEDLQKETEKLQNQLLEKTIQDNKGAE